MSSAVGGPKLLQHEACYEPDRARSAVAARLPHLGPVADVDRHVAGHAERVAAGRAAPSRRAAPVPSSSIRITQLKVPRSPISSSALSATSQVIDRLLGLVEGDARRDLERLDQRVRVVQRRRQLGLALVVDAAPDRRRPVAAARSACACAMRPESGSGPTTWRPACRRARAPGRPRAASGQGPSSATRTTRSTASALPSGSGIDSPRPATARDPGDGLGEHRPHAVVGLHGHHLVGPPDQQPGQRTGTRPRSTTVPPTRRRQDPVHRLDRRARAVALVVRGRAAEAGGPRGPWSPGSGGRCRARACRRPYVGARPRVPGVGPRPELRPRRVSRAPREVAWRTSGSRRWPRRSGAPRSACPSRSTGR